MALNLILTLRLNVNPKILTLNLKFGKLAWLVIKVLKACVQAESCTYSALRRSDLCHIWAKCSFVSLQEVGVNLVLIFNMCIN